MGPDRRRPPGWREWAAPAAAVLLACLAHANALNNPFVYDDYRTIVGNASLDPGAGWRAVLLFDLTRPLTNVSFWLDRAIWGRAEFGFHLTNLVLHALNVWLLFLFARRCAAGVTGFATGSQSGPASESTSLATGAAFVAAALFAVHPLLTEAVGYASSRSDLLAATFILAGMLATARWIETARVRWIGAAVVCWLAGMAAKETAVVLPVLMLSYDAILGAHATTRAVTTRGGRGLGRASAPLGSRVVRVYLPLVVVAVAAGLWRLRLFVSHEHAGGAVFEPGLALAQLDVIRRYVSLAVLPAGQAIYHDVSRAGAGALVAGAAVAAGLAGAVWRFRRRVPALSYGALWFLLLVLPSSTLAALGRGLPMAEHRVYAASCGLFLAAGVGVALFASRPFMTWRLRWLVSAAVAAVLLSFGGRTHLRNLVWSDPVGLWAEAASAAPRAALPHLALGEALQLAGRTGEAIAAYETALSLDPDDELTYVKLATGLAGTGRTEEAAAVAARLTARRPGSANASISTGLVELLSGRTDPAREHFSQALRVASDDVLALRWLAVLEEDFARNPSAALATCQRLARVLPMDAETEQCIARNAARRQDGD